MRHFRLWVMMAAAMLVAPASLNAQSVNWIEQAYDRYVAETRGRNGNLLSWFANSVNQGQVWRMNFTPRASGTHYFSGACDEDCSQFSITVFDCRNTQIARQIAYSGGRTTVSAWLNAGQSYYVQFYPENCSTAFCYTIGAAWR